MDHLPLQAEQLKKLTIPQLKALCRERKITAYSKLQKSAIIERLLATKQPQILEKAGAPCTENLLAANVPAAAASSAPTQSSSSLFESTEEGIEPSRESVTDGSIPTASPATDIVYSEPANNDPPIRSSPPVSPVTALGKRSLDLDNTYTGSSSTSTQHKRLKIAHPIPLCNAIQSPLGNAESANLRQFPQGPSYLSRNGCSLAKTKSPIVREATKSAYSQATERNRNEKRYKPLILSEKVASHAHPIALAPSKKSYHADRPYLDLPSASGSWIPKFPLIGLPPPLSQRRLVSVYSVAFSLVDEDDLRSLFLVSRLIRYAGLVAFLSHPDGLADEVLRAAHHSAVERLKRYCLGARLTNTMNRHPSNTTNFWPYLKCREREHQEWRAAINSSILSSELNKNTMSPRLTWSPDSPKQATVAARFLLTHLYFEISVGMKIAEPFVVLDAQEIVADEVWLIKLRSQQREYAFYVLEATCEVIGTIHREGESSTSSDFALRPRADWSAYIQQYVRTTSSSVTAPSLLSQLTWAHHEEYHQGISRLWLKRVEQSSELGGAHLAVARRYLLACVVGNSISGRWMSSTEMAQEFNGLSTTVDPLRRPLLTRKLNLFLPAHHHIESLHFTTNRGRPLHAGVAAVQTPHRTYYVLKDNGMQIGCEEEGIAPIWMELLKCASDGVAV